MEDPNIIEVYLKKVADILQVNLSDLKLIHAVTDVNGVTTKKEVTKVNKLNYISIHNGTFKITLMDIGIVIALFKLSQMPGCCGVCISHNAAVIPPYQNKGLGTLLNQFRIDFAREAGFTIMLCTDKDVNAKSVKLLKTNGWERLAGFNNRRTKNDVSLHIKYL